MQQKSRFTGGFTLIEMLVVVLIIGILAAIALPQYQRAVDKSRAAQLQTALAEVVRASDLYYLHHGTYPVSFDDLELNLPGFSKQALASGAYRCANNWVHKDTLWGKDFSISLYRVNWKVRIFAYFNTGKYNCRGFAHFTDENNEENRTKVQHKTLCAEDSHSRACLTGNCHAGMFCEDVMGKQKFVVNKYGSNSYDTFYLYSL